MIDAGLGAGANRTSSTVRPGMHFQRLHNFPTLGSPLQPFFLGVDPS
jgi:hypothetical protein